MVGWKKGRKKKTTTWLLLFLYAVCVVRGWRRFFFFFFLLPVRGGLDDCGVLGKPEKAGGGSMGGVVDLSGLAIGRNRELGFLLARRPIQNGRRPLTPAKMGREREKRSRVERGKWVSPSHRWQRGMHCAMPMARLVRYTRTHLYIYFLYSSLFSLLCVCIYLESKN